MENAFIALGIVAVTELAKRVKASDWEGVAVIVAAAVIGALAGYFHVQGVANVGDGLTIALAAVGAHTTARQIG